MRFQYLEASSMGDAVSLLDKYNGTAKVIAGGTDLVIQMRRKLKRPEYIINIGKIKELGDIKFDAKGSLKIGALATVSSLEKSPEVRRRFPVISYAASQLASVAIRNLATVGGNICNASPSADTPPSLIVLSAKLRIVGPGGERWVPLEDFFTGPGQTVLGRGEMLTEIVVPPMPPRTGAAYFKHGIRGSIDLAIVGVAAAITLEDDRDTVRHARIVLGAVAPTPMRARQCEDMLKGKKITGAEIEKAAEVASGECRPITDVRSTLEYRCEMINVFTRYAIRKALELARAA